MTVMRSQAIANEKLPVPANDYDAFISYSHKDDAKYAKLIHHRLQTFATPLLKARKLQIFLDDASLAMSEDLWSSIEAHLEKSSYLIVLLSPAAADSPWVEREVRSFVQGHKNRRVGIVVTQGKTPWTDECDFDPNAPDAAVSTSLIQMLSTAGKEPLVIDLRPFRSFWRRWFNRWEFDNRLASIASRLANRRKDELFGIHIKRLRQRLAAFGALAACLVIATLAAINFGVDAQEEAAVSQSRQLAANARIVIDDNPDLALLLAAEAYATRPTAEAREALFTSLTRHPHLAQVVPAIPNNASTLLLAESGKRILAFNGSSLYRMYDALTLAPMGPIRTIPGKQTLGIDIDWQARLLVAGQARGTLRVLDLDSGEELASLELAPEAQEDIRDVAVPPGGQQIAAVVDEDIDLIRVSTGPQHGRPKSEKPLVTLKPVRRLEKAHPVSINNLVFLPDGRLMSIGWDSRIRIWDVDTGRLIAALDPESGSNESRLRPSEDGRFVSAPRTGGVFVWDLEQSALVHPKGFRAEVKIPPEPANGRLSPDGRWVAAPWWQAGAFVWDVDSGELQAGPLLGHARNAIETLFLPGGKRLLTASSDQKMQVWDLETPYAFLQRNDSLLLCQEVIFSPLGKHLAVIGENNVGENIRLHALANDGISENQPHWTAEGNAPLAFHPGGTMIAYNSGDSVSLRGLDGKLLVEIQKYESPVTALTFHPGGEVLATGHKDGSVHFWRSSNGSTGGKDIPSASTLPDFLPRHVSSLHWLQDSKTLLIGTGDGRLRVRDIAADNWIRPSDPNPHIPEVWSNFGQFEDLYVAVDEPRQRLVMVCRDAFQILELGTGRPLTQEIVLPPRGHIARAVCYAPQSGTMAVVMGRNVHGSAVDGVITMVDVASGQLLGRPLERAPGQLSAAISPSGNTMVTGGTKGLMVWSLDPIQWQRQARRIAGRSFSEIERSRFHLD